MTAAATTTTVPVHCILLFPPPSLLLCFCVFKSCAAEFQSFGVSFGVSAKYEIRKFDSMLRKLLLRSTAAVTAAGAIINFLVQPTVTPGIWWKWVEFRHNKDFEGQLRDLHVVPPNNAVSTFLTECFATKMPLHGIDFVVGAKGAGKSTYVLQMLAKRQQEGLPSILLDTAPTNEKDFLDRFSVTTQEELFAILPDDCVVVVDQCEKGFLWTDEMRHWLHDLATTSSNRKRAHFVFLVSDDEVARRFRTVNNGEKCRQIGHANDFMWTEKQIREYVQSVDWAPDEKEELVQMGLQALLPGFLYQVSKSKSTYFDDKRNLQKLVQQYRDQHVALTDF